MLSLLFLFSIFIWIYSYGFTDLNLTLSSNHYVLSFIHFTQKLVYFNRPLSTRVYLGLILIFYLIYLLILNQVKNFSKLPWRWLLIIALVFTLAYPFLSHDSFKYLFAAKMVVKYHLNPHTHSPNFIQGDDWLRFMRWVHTPSPYGPIFTLITIPAYLLGLGKFVPSLFILKLLNFGWYVLAIIFIGKISLKLNFTQAQTVFNQLFFALNPLILIENLANAHNDMPMMALFLIGFYLFLQSKYYFSLLTFKSALLILLSLGIKYITAIFLPVYLIRKNITPQHLLNFLLLIFFIVPIAYYVQFQPWYITWTLTLIALHPSRRLKYLAIAYSFGGFMRYLPFIYTGLWSATKFQFNLLTFIPLLFTSLFYLVRML